MISLFITCLLSFFCCSSFNTYSLDNSKEIDIKDTSIQCAVPVHTDDDGHISNAIFFNSDLVSYEFYMNMVTSLVTTLNRPSFSLNANGLDSYTFSNVQGYIYSTYPRTNEFLQDKLFDITSITFSKTSFSTFVVDGQTLYDADYNMTFYNGSTQIFRIAYLVRGPIGFLPVVSFIFQSSLLSGNNWCYWEYNDVSVGPIITYCYNQLYLDLNNAYYTSVAYDQGYNDGLSSGKSQGYQEGYNQGLLDGADYDDIALTIFTGVIDIGLMPVNFFLRILDFEVFGINIAGFVSSLLTIAIVIIVIRLVTGKKE